MHPLNAPMVFSAMLAWAVVGGVGPWAGVVVFGSFWVGWGGGCGVGSLVRDLYQTPRVGGGGAGS